MNPLIQLKQAISVFLIALACFALAPLARAACGTPDGGCGRNNTAEGEGALSSLTTGFGNTAIGHNALFNEAIGNYNTATGAGALKEDNGTEYNTADGFQTLFKNTTGFFNTAIGAAALHENISGAINTATGLNALRNNQTGNHNTATGAEALKSNTDGSRNTANGSGALHENTHGKDNTAIGSNALFNNTQSDDNTAIGHEALFSNLPDAFGNPAPENTAVGSKALRNNTGSGNVAVGFEALHHLQTNTGSDNVAIGRQTLHTNTSGADNTAIGVQAASVNEDGEDNTAIGFWALQGNVSGKGNTVIGTRAAPNMSGSFNVVLGGPNEGGTSAGEGIYTADDVICIGSGNIAHDNVSHSCFISNISGKPSPGGTAVYINSDDKLGTMTSSRRFKDDIKPIDKASEAVFAFKPVTFRYKKEIDPTGVSQFGLVAEDVEKVNPDLVVRDKEGKPYTVRYEAVNAMLLNEFLKEHRKVEQLEKQVEALTAGLQKVSAQLELSKPAPQIVLNNH